MARRGRKAEVCDLCGADIPPSAWRGLVGGKRYCGRPPCRETHWRAVNGHTGWIERVGHLDVPFLAHHVLCGDGVRRMIRLRGRSRDGGDLAGVVTMRDGGRRRTVRGLVVAHGEGDLRFVPDPGRRNSALLPE